jgi:hypothetical protein
LIEAFFDHSGQVREQSVALPNVATLTDYWVLFAGYGQWCANLVCQVEETGGKTESAVTKNLDAWHQRGCNKLELESEFYPDLAKAYRTMTMPSRSRSGHS